MKKFTKWMIFCIIVILWSIYDIIKSYLHPELVEKGFGGFSEFILFIFSIIFLISYLKAPPA